MHLTIYFCGTQETVESFLGDNFFERNTLMVKGCSHPDVCNTGLFPNLKQFAERFTQRVFSTRNDTIFLASGELPGFRVGIEEARIVPADRDTPITGITLCGHSRGAVTCFEVARQLHQLAPHI